MYIKKGYFSKRKIEGKRIFDLVFSIVFIISLLPLMVIVSCMVLTVLGYPVFFIQKRIGINGKLFRMYKFRTMANEIEDKAADETDEKRLNRYGRLMRSSSMDELPGLLNVLKGEMSLVGPRPLLMQYLDRYTPEQARRHEVKPGITGWAQVNGRNALTWEEKFKLDVWYVDNVSFALDLKIIALTIWKVLKREGINQPGQATMKEFMGSNQ